MLVSRELILEFATAAARGLFALKGASEKLKRAGVFFVAGDSSLAARAIRGSAT